MANTTGNKRTIIIIAIVAVLALCCCGVVAFGGLAYLGLSEEDSSSTSAVPTNPADSDDPAVSGEAPGGDSGDAPSDDIWGEASRFVATFYPDYELIDLQEAGTEGDWTTFHMMAAGNVTPQITIGTTARRLTPGASSAAPSEWELYEDAETVTLWAHDKLSSGVYGFASPEGLFIGARVLEEFAAIHPGQIVVDFSIWNTMEVSFHSIDEEEWADWDGASASHTSDWAGDLMSSTWSETSYE